MKGTLDLALSLGIVALAMVFAALRIARTLRRGKPACCSDADDEAACEDGLSEKQTMSACACCDFKERCAH